MNPPPLPSPDNTGRIRHAAPIPWDRGCQKPFRVLDATCQGKLRRLQFDKRREDHDESRALARLLWMLRKSFA